MVSTIMGVFYIIGAIYVGIFTFNNCNNMPCSIHGLNEENYEVIDKMKFNKIMIIQNTLSCMLFLLSGVLCIIWKRPTAVALPTFNIFIDRTFSKISKRYTNIY